MMAKTPHSANTPSMYPMLRIMQYERGKLANLVDNIWEALLHGPAVLMKGWELEAVMEFSVPDIAKYRPPIWQEVIWQGAGHRDVCPQGTDMHSLDFRHTATWTDIQTEAGCSRLHHADCAVHLD